jgi:hypothetical protein
MEPLAAELSYTGLAAWPGIKVASDIPKPRNFGGNRSPVEIVLSLRDTS